MQVFKGYKEIGRSFPKTCLTIGNFDGLHVGHRTIIDGVIARAKQIGGTSVVYTFRPHPQAVLSPDTELALINTYEDKLELLKQMGVDVVIEEPFNRDFSTTSPTSFFSDVLVKRMGSVAIYVGYDFGFGKDRSGSLDLLKKSCADQGVECKVFTPYKVGDQVCSSSQIRKLIRDGQIKGANELLGREFFYKGHVVKGQGRGKTIGFATANVHTGNKILAKEGVYATRAMLAGKTYASVTNIGRQPTFNGDSSVPIVMETHLLDFNQDIYGETLQVSLVDRLRNEMKFSSVDELVGQIKNDVAAARSILK